MFSQFPSFPSQRNDEPPSLGRREFMTHLAMTAGAMALGLPGVTSAGTDPARDWQWLSGNWDVWHSRLKERLAGNNDWQEFAGKSAFWMTMNGLGNVDDNIVEIPSGTYRGLSLRAFDSKTGKWSIWWLDARNPTRIEPPVLGGFRGDEGEFIGQDTFKDRPIVVRFRWHEVHGKRPWWDQAFSTDNGATWEINWRNYFTRTAAMPTPLPKVADAPQDWDFLAGHWRVQHRRLRQRLVGSNEWDSFAGTYVHWPVLGGHGNVSDNVMEFPSGTVRGMGLRAYDATTGQWSSWWVDSRNPASIGLPLRGRIDNGVGTFIGEEEAGGRLVTTRVQWSRLSSQSARWEQASSVDGKHWETNWISEFQREG